MARAWKTFLICPRCGGPLRHASSVRDDAGRLFCGLACRRKQIRDDRKFVRQKRRSIRRQGRLPVAQVNAG